jgi:hypothetical protein
VTDARGKLINEGALSQVRAERRRFADIRGFRLV